MKPSDLVEKFNLGPKKDDDVLAKKWNELSKASPGKKVAIGAAAGWVCGFTFSKAGKMAASAIGGGLLLFHIGQQMGYIKVNWSRVKRDVNKAKQELENNADDVVSMVKDSTREFVKENAYLATGFAGGFFLGIASS